MTSQGEQLGRYAKPEFERRFLLPAVPRDATRPRHLVDRYLVGARLRLRRVDRGTGSEPVLKLGHKVRSDPGDPTTVMHTTMYLSPDEFALLEPMAAMRVEKTRYRWSVSGRRAAVDRFVGPLEGLICAEVEFDSAADLADFVPPASLGPEITRREELIGPNLASLDRAAIEALMATAMDAG